MLLYIIPALLSALFLALTYFGYRLTFYYKDPKKGPFRYRKDDQTEKHSEALDKAIKEFHDAPYENASITSHDGLRLCGKYYHYADGAPLQIMCHGYKGNAIRDFCGQWQISRELGHNVLLIDQRSHGESEGHSISFGILERRDVLDWINYACERFGDVSILLLGVSMGAATVLMVSGMELPENVKGIIADCPYDAPENIIKKVLGQDMGVPVYLMYPFIRLGGRLLGRFDIEAASPIEALKRTEKPILLIHGDDDRFVPCDMSRAMHAAAPDKTELHIIPGSGHALNYISDPVKYRAALKAFAEKYTGG